eukprot:g4410.t1
MHGVALGVSRSLIVEDLTHAIPTYNIWEAAYRLDAVADFWPAGTVFVSVVDPGVGSDRKSVVLKTKTGHYFVTPDNGTLTLVADRLGIVELREIDEQVNRLEGSEASHTFHGRDVYAYTGARLASAAIDFSGVGPLLAPAVFSLPRESARIEDGYLLGGIPVLDPNYGNVWTNIPMSLLLTFAEAEDYAQLYGQQYRLSISRAGQAAPKDSPVHYFDAKSLGFGGTPAGSDAADSLPEYHLPTSEAQLQSLLKIDRDVFLVAGGTDKVLEISQQYQAPVKVIDVTRVDHLNKIDVTDTHIDIGAAASYSAVEDVFADYSSELIALLHRLGSRQIRNRGTLGGNIANGSPIADTPPVLFVWQAEIEAVNSQGQRRWVDINAFYKGYRDTVLATDEYIARIRIQKEEIARPHRFYKVSKRFEDDISAVMGAFVIEHQHGECTRLRAAYGGMAATPVRAHKTEQFLVGKQLDPAVAEEACIILEQEFEPLSDVRASAAYRREIAVSLFRKALSELAGIAPALPIASSATRGENYA